MEVKRSTQLFHIYSTIVIVFLSSILHTQAHRWRRQASGGGTSINIQDIFTGRCYEHLQCHQVDRCVRIPRPKDIDCQQVWAAFNATVAYQDPCNASSDAYDEVLKMIPPFTPKDQTLFWSGLLDSAYNVARVSMHYRILEESLPGYIANGLTWCGDESPSGDGFNYNDCPTSYNNPDCPSEISYTFWKAASREFAKQATGDVSVALNGHRVDRDGNKASFQNTSAFATAELPNLNPEKVNKVQILLVPDITKPVNESEKCGEGTILVLQKLIADRGMAWTCEFDPLEFRYIQCTTLDNPLDYAACTGGSSDGSSGGSTKDHTVAILIGAVILLVVILIVVAVIFAVRYRSCALPRKSRGADAYPKEPSSPTVLLDLNPITS